MKLIVESFFISESQIPVSCVKKRKSALSCSENFNCQFVDFPEKEKKNISFYIININPEILFKGILLEKKNLIALMIIIL